MQRSILALPGDDPSEDEVDTGSVVPDDEGPRHHRVGPLAWALVAAVVVAAVAGLGALSQVRASRHADAVAALPGFLRPMEHTPHIGWSVDRSSTTSVLAADGQLIVLDAVSGTWQLSGRDAGSGEQRWSIQLGAAARSGFEAGQATCPSAGPDVGPTILCAVTAPVPSYPGSTATPTTDIVAIDAATGLLVGRWPVAEEMTAIARTGDDVIVATIGDGDHEAVTRANGRTGEALWRLDVPTTTNIGANPIGSGLPRRVPVTISVTAGLAAVSGRDVMVVGIDDGTERWLGQGIVTSYVSLASDSFSTWQITAGGHDRDTSGSITHDLPGLPVALSADDGSLDTMTIVDLGTAWQAVDRETGEEVWTAPQFRSPDSIVDGSIVAYDEVDVSVMSGKNGETRWVFTPPNGVVWRPVSDGSVVVVPSVGAKGEPQASGLSVKDGTRYWSVDLPAGVERIEAVGGQWVVWTADSVVLLR